MDKHKIIELLKNESIKEVKNIHIEESLNCGETRIEIRYENAHCNPGIITQEY